MEKVPADNHTLHQEMSEEEARLQLPQDLNSCLEDIPGELRSALLILMKYYHQQNKSKSVMRLFKNLTEYISTKGSNKVLPSFAENGLIKYYKHHKEETLGVDQVLLKQVNLKRQLIMESQNQWDCDIIFIFCPIYSRVGADVEAAMTDWLDAKQIILVLMHHTHKASYSPSEKKWSDIYQNIILQLHLLFHDTVQGLLKCEKNDRAVYQLQKFLMLRSKEMDKNTDLNTQTCSVQ